MRTDFLFWKRISGVGIYTNACEKPANDRSLTGTGVLFIQRIKNRAGLDIQLPAIVGGPKVHLEGAHPLLERQAVFRRGVAVALEGPFDLHFLRQTHAKAPLIGPLGAFIKPGANARLEQTLPGQLWPWVTFAPERHIRMADDISGAYLRMTRANVVDQRDQYLDLLRIIGWEGKYPLIIAGQVNDSRCRSSDY